tara:strand:+ start:192 stop:782 length:591 start_codon:yes stop_codon:yes gene_type:complete
MEFIVHRINTIKELKNTPNKYGVEVDLRDYGKKIILQHDPFKVGEDFEEYLKFYNHGTLILNIKSERIENKVIKLIKKYKIKKYFLLDCTFPMIHLLINKGEQNIAIRFSEYECVETVLKLKRNINWVWVDCFSKIPINIEIYKLIKNSGIKLCLVSPDLQSQQEKIEEYKSYILKEGISFDAICCKRKNIIKWNL